jgi:23S rRNA pseudouridine2457 synthase
VAPPVISHFHPNSKKLYLAFFKPYGVLSQFTQPDDSEKKTLKEFDFPENVYPIGRLDWDSEGLLLLSDDPKLNEALLHPSRRHRRTYLAQVDNVPDQKALQQLESGVIIQGAKTLPAQAKLLEGEPHLPPRPVPIRYRKEIPTAWIELSITEGKNRQVRKMTAAVGHPTLRLVRVSIGGLKLTGLALQPGEWIRLSEQQILSAFA